MTKRKYSGTPAERLAARQAAYRQRHNVKPFTVNLPVDLLAEFDFYLRFKNYTRSGVIEKLIRTQLLRKR